MELRLTAAASLSLTKKSVYLPSNVRSPQNPLKAYLVDWSNTAHPRVAHAHKHTNAASLVHTWMRWFVQWVET